MNDEEYVRKAVELADGIEFGEAEDQLVIQGETITSVYGLDILAAQLVRQVDGSTRHHVEITHGWAAVRTGIAYEEIRSISASYGPDRTMGTIRVIVDSGVLEQ